MSVASRPSLCQVCGWRHAWLRRVCSRAAAVDVVAALARRCSHPDDQGKIFAALRHVLEGSAEAKPRGVHERIGLVQAVAALAAAPGSATGSAALAEDAVSFLSAYYRYALRTCCCRLAASCVWTRRASVHREEANEDVRTSIVGALGAWLSRLDSWPTSALSRLRDGLGEKEALRRAHLRALVQVRCCRLMALDCLRSLCSAMISNTPFHGCRPWTAAHRRTPKWAP